MPKQKNIDKITNALKDYIQDGVIVLELIPIKGKKIVYNDILQPVEIEENIGILIHSVDVNIFTGLYEDILDNILISNTNKLQAMRNKVFKDTVNNVVDIGYTKFIQQWIDEGITL